MATTGNNLHFIALALVLLCDISRALQLKTCKKIDSCRASTDRGEIDLWPLIKTSTAPRFKDIKVKGNSTFLASWNPCKPWTGKDFCQNNTAVCVSSKTLKSYSIGHASSAKFVLDSSTGVCSLTYTGIFVFNAESMVKIELHCDSEEGRVDVFTNTNSHTTSSKVVFNTRLYSKYACVQASGLSIGSVLCIIFFCSVFVYLIGGMLWMKFSRGATGTEMIPNYSFWVNFFKLIEDGCVFTVEKIKGLCCSTGAGYESI